MTVEFREINCDDYEGLRFSVWTSQTYQRTALGSAVKLFTALPDARWCPDLTAHRVPTLVGSFLA